jgi:hypothetical protein
LSVRDEFFRGERYPTNGEYYLYSIQSARDRSLLVQFLAEYAPGDDPPIVLSSVGIGLIIILGWLGREMVYRLGAAVKQPPDQSI